MKIAESMLPELDQEMAGTRRVLERMPADRFDWQPHAKSMTLGRLASHVATLPEWGSMVLNVDAFDVTGYTVERLTSAEQLVARFDALAKAFRAELAATPDEVWGQTWTLAAGEHVIFSLPRIAVLRSSVFNHIIHHRAQLIVYLRLNDVAVPGLYGPSADEQ